MQLISEATGQDWIEDWSNIHSLVHRAIYDLSEEDIDYDRTRIPNRVQNLVRGVLSIILNNRASSPMRAETLDTKVEVEKNGHEAPRIALPPSETTPPPDLPSTVLELGSRVKQYAHHLAWSPGKLADELLQQHGQRDSKYDKIISLLRKKRFESLEVSVATHHSHLRSRV